MQAKMINEFFQFRRTQKAFSLGSYCKTFLLRQSRQWCVNISECICDGQTQTTCEQTPRVPGALGIRLLVLD
jgi:hypothetical protein